MNYELEKTKKLDKCVSEYFIKNGNSPFLNIDIKDDGLMTIDMEENFKNEVEELFAEDFEIVFSDYFKTIILELIENPETL